MDSLDSPFTIEINGKPVARVGDGASTKTQATIDAGADAAVLTLKDGQLQSGDWLLGRNTTEDRSMRPKKIYWFKKGEEDRMSQPQPVAAEKEGDTYKLTFRGAPLTEEEGNVFADILGESQATVIVKFQ
ncbi:hypothetical protein FB567DRAFT_590252 [Paraphoma chrysanthemicola]|uniref:Uncharacterized protein n=1 Tax=Paraphoma chrysanthemicola TaxID=798071 RepID=A0A8K0W0B8_9PLEO|nr:hypothetical protein FB567DRAFT_590252 [Paraphoma chrysanthemicola]